MLEVPVLESRKRIIIFNGLQDTTMMRIACLLAFKLIKTVDTQKLLAKSDDADLRRKIPTHGGIVCSITLHKMEPNFKVKECSENIHPFRYFSSFLVGVGILKSLLLTLVEGYILV